METINQEDYYYTKQNLKSNIDIRQNINNILINKKQRNPANIFKIKEMKLFIPPKISNIQKIGAYINRSKNELISNKRNEDKIFNTMQTNNNFDDLLNYNTSDDFNDDKMLFERPKIKVRLYSTKDNNKKRNTISSEKNNNPIKYRIHKIKPKNLKCSKETIFSPSKSSDKDKTNQKTINYKVINSIQNSFDSSETNSISKNKEYTSKNYYYNIMQAKNLNKLNNTIENLISNSFNTTRKDEHKDKNKIINKYFCNTNRNNYNKKIIYKKKLEKSKNKNSGTFSNLSYLEKERDKKILNKCIYDTNNKINSNLSNTSHNNNKTCELISYNYQSPNKNSLFTNNNNDIEKIDYCYKNSYIILPTYNRKTKNYNEYIKIENNNINDLIITNNNKGETINFMDTDNQDNKLENYYKKKNYNSVLRNKKSFDFTSTKNSSNNILIKKIKLKRNKDKIIGMNRVNYYIKNNLNININENNNSINNNNINNNKNLNINNTFSNCVNNNNLFGNYKYINENNNIYSSKIQNIPNRKNTSICFNNVILNNKNNKNSFNYNINDNYLYNTQIKYDDKSKELNKNNLQIKSSKKKKLKNVITSIQFRNLKDQIRNNELNDKDIILSEFDNNGKVNIKIKKLNKSIEKVLRENSIKKVNNNISQSKTPKFKNEVLTYVKKNKGTHNLKNKIPTFE